jgi:acylphosphatase
MSQTAKHIIFSGRVQGIGFRFTVLNIANQYQLTGFVRNLPDETVEMLAQGNPDDITNCIRDIQESFAGYITETTIEEATPNPQYKTFKITF